MLDSLTCPICQDELNNPVALHCGHVFCALCLKRADNRAQNSAAVGRCPTCRAPIEGRPVAIGAFVARLQQDLSRPPPVPAPPSPASRTQSPIVFDLDEVVASTPAPVPVPVPVRRGRVPMTRIGAAGRPDDTSAVWLGRLERHGIHGEWLGLSGKEAERRTFIRAFFAAYREQHNTEVDSCPVGSRRTVHDIAIEVRRAVRQGRATPRARRDPTTPAPGSPASPQGRPPSTRDMAVGVGELTPERHAAFARLARRALHRAGLDRARVQERAALDGALARVADGDLCPTCREAVRDVIGDRRIVDRQAAVAAAINGYQPPDTADVDNGNDKAVDATPVVSTGQTQTTGGSGWARSAVPAPDRVSRAVQTVELLTGRGTSMAPPRPSQPGVDVYWSTVTRCQIFVDEITGTASFKRRATVIDAPTREARLDTIAQFEYRSKPVEVTEIDEPEPEPGDGDVVMEI